MKARLIKLLPWLPGALLVGATLLFVNSPLYTTPAPARPSPSVSVPATPTLSPTSTPAPSATAQIFATSRPPTVLTPTATPGPRSMPEGYRVQIPRLGIDLPIFEGDVARDTLQQQTPEDAAFHLPGTAIPEQKSNTYLYAHARIGMFLALWQARTGDEVFISTPDRRLLTYVVSEVRPRVDAGDISVIQPTTKETLTLQTSTGPNPNDPRFVVIALPRE